MNTAEAQMKSNTHHELGGGSDTQPALVRGPTVVFWACV